MKILRYKSNGQPSYGVLNEDDSISELIGSPFDNFTVGGQVGDINDSEILPPVEPSKIIAVGLNYMGHIQEMKHDAPKVPMLFMKPNSSVIGQGEAIVYPKKAELVEHEAELVVVMGKAARHVSEENALDYVLGYTCGNDVSERVIQRAEMKTGAMVMCKGFDTFSPLGPVVDTTVDPTNAAVITRVNGEVKQSSNSSDLLFSVATLIAFLTETMTLYPGDIIYTGTPSGVSPITPGDVVEIEIGGVGILRNPVIQEN